MTGVGAIASSYAPAGGTFTPTDITGLQLWLDASDTSTIAGTGGTVTQWDDKSANGFALTPVFTGPTTGGRTINGLNAIDFSAAGNQLRYIGSTTVGQPLTVISVALNDVPTTGGGGRVVSGESTASFQHAHSDGGASYRTGLVYAGGADFAKGPADAITTAAAHVVSSVVNGASTVVYVDGVAGSSFNAGSTGLKLVIVGSRGINDLPLDGLIAEVIVYDSALSSTDRQAVENYLSAKWGTP